MREVQVCQGSVYFRLRSGIVDNPKHFQDSLNLDLYRYPALKPPMPWIDDQLPNPPRSLSIDGNFFYWSAPEVAADGDTAYQYVIYSSLENTIDHSDPANIYRIVQAPTNSIPLNADANIYGITALDRIGNESEMLTFSPAVVAEDQRPDERLLLQAYPNPFNPSVQLELHLRASSYVSLVIHDLQGREVNTIFSGELPPGNHAFPWHVENAQGLELHAGVYIATLRSSNASTSAKLVYLK